MALEAATYSQQRARGTMQPMRSNPEVNLLMCEDCGTFFEPRDKYQRQVRRCYPCIDKREITQQEKMK